MLSTSRSEALNALDLLISNQPMFDGDIAIYIQVVSFSFFLFSKF